MFFIRRKEDMNSNSRKFVRIWRKKDLINYVLADLDKRIKKDDATKLSVFFTGLSAYLPEPMNLFIKGESGTGKSYNVVETLNYFPQEDVVFLGHLSPKALIHGHGILVDKYGRALDLTDKPIKPKRKDYESEDKYKEALEKYREQLKAYADKVRDSYTIIDLSHKILVFLEAPESETFRMLYPILSHDRKKIEYRFTDKTEKGQFKQSRVVIKSFPATLFLSTEHKYVEELSTRGFTVTPEASKEKIDQANILTNLKAAQPWQYDHETEETKVIRTLIESLKKQMEDGKTDLVVPFLNLHEIFPKEIVRDMRDFQHFIQFLKAVTFLHFYQRPLMKIEDKRFLVSNVEDVKKSLELYMKIFETTRTGTQQRILNFYHEIVKKKTSWRLKEITEEYNKTHKKKLSSETIRKKLERLDEIGYVDTQKDAADKRLNVYIPLVSEDEKDAFSQNLENLTILSSKLKTGLDQWIEKIRQTASFYSYKDLGENRWGEVEIDLKEVKKLILGRDSSCQIFLEKNSKPKIQKNVKNIDFSKKREISNSSDFNKPGPLSEKEDNILLEFIDGSFVEQSVNLDNKNKQDICNRKITESETEN